MPTVKDSNMAEQSCNHLLFVAPTFLNMAEVRIYRCDKGPRKCSCSPHLLPEQEAECYICKTKCWRCKKACWLTDCMDRTSDSENLSFRIKQLATLKKEEAPSESFAPVIQTTVTMHTTVSSQAPLIS